MQHSTKKRTNRDDTIHHPHAKTSGKDHYILHHYTLQRGRIILLFALSHLYILEIACSCTSLDADPWRKSANNATKSSADTTLQDLGWDPRPGLALS
jgi:hypothetical protein